MSLKNRNLCVAVLAAVEKGAKLQEALANAFQNGKSVSGDTAAISDLLYSYYRGKVRIDWLLGRFLSNPVKLPPKMLASLGLAAASLLYQNNPPPYAVVSETVAQIKKEFGGKLAGVANGFLRTLLRLGEGLHKPEWYAAEAGQEAGIAIYYGLPPAIAQLWVRSYGTEVALKLMERSSRRPWKGLLVNPDHPDAVATRASLTAVDGAIGLGKWGVVMPPGTFPEAFQGKSLAPLVAGGAISSIAAGSQLVLAELGLENWVGPFWDCCAGVGGKTRVLASMGCRVALVSDISAQRLAVFRQSWKKELPLLCQMDARFPALKRWQGDIVADVPCSGLGVLARRPDLRKNAKNLSVFLKELAITQTAIIMALLSLLEPGRHLAYLTCTLNPAENREVIEKALVAFPACRLAREWQTPHDHPWLEGMYGAVVQKI